MVSFFKGYRNGLAVNVQVSPCNGATERAIATQLLADAMAPTARDGRVGQCVETLSIVKNSRDRPRHVAVVRNIKLNGGTVIDARTNRYFSWQVSGRKRRRIEQCFDRGKVMSPVRQVLVEGFTHSDNV